jgi:uncharacterized protein (TIGR02596 family)
MAILAGFLAPAIGSILGGSNLTRGGEVLVGQLALARQLALSRNRVVEVRLFQYCSPTGPGEVGGSPASGRFRAMQSFEISESGDANALGRIQQLPDQVCIDSGGTLSSLIGAAGAPPVVPGATLGADIPQVGKNYNALSFQFRPDGSMNLDRLGKWFLTVHSTKDADGAATPPANYVTIQIDPANGNINTFRP